MNWVFVTVIGAIFSQLFFVYFIYSNYRYALKKSKKVRSVTGRRSF